MRLSLGYYIDLVIGTTIPFRSDAFSWFDGSIAGDYFVDKTGRSVGLLITGKDFDISDGFPYKSAATVSAPVGDTLWISKDTTNFWYDSGGTPNQIPITSLFQDIDYAHWCYTLHKPQILDGDGIEIYEPRVKNIVLYANVKIGADLIKCQTYFGVPTELTTSIKWADFVNGLDTNDGSKATPYKTLTKVNAGTAGTSAYAITGNYKENGAGFNLYITKNITYLGLGLNVIQQTNQDYVIYLASTTTATFKRFLVDAETKSIGIRIYGTDKYYQIEKVYFKNSSNYSIYSESPSITPQSIVNAVFKCNNANAVRFGAPFTFDTCMFTGTTSEGTIYPYTKTAEGDLTLLNCRAKITSHATTGAIVKAEIANQFNVIIKGGKYEITDYGKPCVILNQKSADIKNVTMISPETGGSALTINSTTTQSSKSHVTGCNFISKNKGSYIVSIGGEVTGAGNDKLLDVRLKGNKYLGALHFNPLLTNVIQHGVFVGFQSHVEELNEGLIDGAGIGLVIKGSNTNFSNTKFKSKIIKNSYSYGIYFKGATNCKIYGFTLINNGEGFHLTGNTGSDGAINQDIKNCIVIEERSYLFNAFADSLNGHTLDYNIYYSPLAKPFRLGSTEYAFAEWQALGYDTHSVMLPSLADAKALFVDYDNGDYSLSVNSVAKLFCPKIVGYTTALDKSTAWGADSALPSVVIIDQSGDMVSCGAYGN